MNAQGFVNRIRSLWNLDRSDVPFMSDDQWPKFRDDPPGFLMRTDDSTTERIFAAVEARQKPHASPMSAEERDVLNSFAIYTVEDDEDGIRLSIGGHPIACWGAYSPEGMAMLKLDAKVRDALSTASAKPGEAKRYPLGYVTVRATDTGDGIIINAADAKEWGLREDAPYSCTWEDDTHVRIAIPASPANPAQVTDAMVEAFIGASSVAAGNTEECVRAGLTAAIGAAPEEDTESQWRDLALQFDGHRIQAMCLLRAIAADKAGKAEIEAFLSAPPLSGDQVLADRIAAIGAGGQAIAVLPGCLKVGHHVRKTSGYPFPGEVRAVFKTRSGLIRYVIEATGVDYAGMLHIFSPGQLAAATDKGL